MIMNIKQNVLILTFILFFFFLPSSYAETGLSLALDSGLMDEAAKGPTNGPFLKKSMNGDCRLSAQIAMNDSTEESSAEVFTAEFHESDLRRKKNYFTVLLGAVYWKNLHDIEYDFSVSNPTEYGTFNEWGYNIELGYHRQVSRWLENDVLLGIDFGIFNNENDKDFSVTILPSGRRLKGSIDARTLYITPSVRLLIEKKGYPRFLVGSGLGYYLVDFAEQLSGGMEVDEYFEEVTIGGYLSLGVDFPLSNLSERTALRVESKVHFVNFGDLGGIAPEAGDLKGPVYMFQVGITF